MATYAPGALVQHLMKIRIDGDEAGVGDVSSLSGKVYVDGVYNSGATVSISSLGTGTWRVQYTVPAGLANGADLDCIVDMSVSGYGKTAVFRDQVQEITSPSTIRTYLQTNPIQVGLTTSARDDLVTRINTGGIAAEDIAKQVLLVGVSDALGSGTMDRHSLGSLVLIATNADTTSSPGKITARHPDTDAAVFQYTITTGAGCPIQSVT